MVWRLNKLSQMTSVQYYSQMTSNTHFNQVLGQLQHTVSNHQFLLLVWLLFHVDIQVHLYRHTHIHTHVMHRSLRSQTLTANFSFLCTILPFDAHCCHMGTAIKHPVPDQVKQSFVIFDILALW